MKTNTSNEGAVLLKAVNGDKKGPNEQVTDVVDQCGVFNSHQDLQRSLEPPADKLWALMNATEM